jgi:energy-coupling factor transporter ATP-binding protein EcfA2
VAFPARPEPFRGRAAELRTLAAACRSGLNPRLALVGPGGSGKSTLAAALGHRLRSHYPGGIEWFRVGRWDHRTLVDMLAIRMKVPLGGLQQRRQRVTALRRHLEGRRGTFIVLDNHEDDREMARLLNVLDGLPVSWLLTARRCLLSGVSVFPVVAPLATAGRSPFPRVAELTGLLRWNPLALDISNALVDTGVVTAAALRAWLVRSGIARVSAIAHEDDLPELRLLVGWAWPRVGATARRLLTVLAHLEGDHVDADSLAALARAGRESRRALALLTRWHLVQEPLPGRYALHATIRHAIEGRTHFDQARAVKHFVVLLENNPERLDLEQTHLFAAMDHAHTTSDLGLALRLEKLLERLGLA